MNDFETSERRSSGGAEADRRHDGAGRNEPLPGSDARRKIVEPNADAPKGAEEQWTPERGSTKPDPANTGPSEGADAGPPRGQERVEDRSNVGIVKPEDYPDRSINGGNVPVPPD